MIVKDERLTNPAPERETTRVARAHTHGPFCDRCGRCLRCYGDEPCDQSVDGRHIRRR